MFFINNTIYFMMWNSFSCNQTVTKHDAATSILLFGMVFPSVQASPFFWKCNGVHFWPNSSTSDSSDLRTFLQMWKCLTAFTSCNLSFFFFLLEKHKKGLLLASSLLSGLSGHVWTEQVWLWLLTLNLPASASIFTKPLDRNPIFFLSGIVVWHSHHVYSYLSILTQQLSSICKLFPWMNKISVVPQLSSSLAS